MYGKLFAQMYDGTLATKGPWEALVTFQQLVILASRDGVVDMTAESIARRTTIPIEIIRTGLSALEQPDPESRTPTEEGRRIVRLSSGRAWGWQIVNHEHYRRVRNEDDRRTYMRDLMRERRADEAAASTLVEAVVAPEAEEAVSSGVSNVNGSSHIAVSRKQKQTQKQEGQKPVGGAEELGSANENGRPTSVESPTAGVAGAPQPDRPQTGVTVRSDVPAPQNGSGVLVRLAEDAPRLPALRGKRDATAVRERLGAVFAEIHGGTRDRMRQDQLARLNAEIVFLYWTARFNHPGAIYDSKREARILARLKENGGDVGELLYALDGAARDDRIMATGRYVGETKYDGIETVLRDRGQVEKFSATRRRFVAGEPHPALAELEKAVGKPAATDEEADGR